MKITASKVSAIVFTLVAVAAFSWMTLRPKAERQATGFALASTHTKAKTTTTTTAPNTTQETTTSTDTTTTEPAVSTPDASTDDQNTPETDTTDTKKDNNSADEATENTTNDTPEKDAEESDAPIIEKTLTTEPDVPNTPNEEQQPAEPTATSTPTTDTDKTEAQDAEKKKTDNNTINHTTENAVDTPQTQAIATTESTAPATDTTTQAPQALKSNDAVDTTDTNPSDIAPQSEPIASTEEKPAEKTSAPVDPSVAPIASDLNNANTTTTATPETTATIAPVAATVLTQVAQKKPEENVATETEFYIPAETPRGTVIMLHGCDSNPSTADNLIQTLLKRLPKQGWNTLTFPLPTLSTASTYKDLGKIMPTVATLIEKNIADTKAKNQLPIVLLAHSCGSQMALAWIEKKGSDSIDAYIGIGTGMMNTALDTAGHLSKPIESMKFPQLDIFGSVDNEAVRKTAPERLAHINRAANPASRQKIILDADHNMTGKGEIISKMVSKWLNRKAFN